MKYHFFLDETGDHGLSYIDRNFPLFLLCGCLFREDSLLAGKSNANIKILRNPIGLWREGKLYAHPINFKL